MNVFSFRKSLSSFMDRLFSWASATYSAIPLELCKNLRALSQHVLQKTNLPVYNRTYSLRASTPPVLWALLWRRDCTAPPGSHATRQGRGWTAFFRARKNGCKVCFHDKKKVVANIHLDLHHAWNVLSEVLEADVRSLEVSRENEASSYL